MFVKKRFKTLIERNRWFKSVPNALTLCNSVCGFGAILYTLRAYSSSRGVTDVFAISACIILFAMVFDALDGFAARIFNAASMKGIQMDSLADMVTFGVAPATLVAIMAHHLKQMSNSQYLIVCGLAAVYLGGAALRLATYNVHAMLEKKSSDKFTGLPTPGAAAAICSIVIFCNTGLCPVGYLSFFTADLCCYFRIIDDKQLSLYTCRQMVALSEAQQTSSAIVINLFSGGFHVQNHSNACIDKSLYSFRSDNNTLG